VTDKPTWTFLTNHAHVLVCIAEEPDIRGRDVALRVGITERAAQSIIADLVASGYVTRRREGRRNRYTVHESSPLRHPIESEHTVGELLVMLGRVRPAKVPAKSPSKSPSKAPSPRRAPTATA